MSTHPSRANPTRKSRRLRIGVVTAAAVAVAGGGLAFYEISTAPDLSGTAGVNTAEVSDVGDVLVDANGNTLYMFEPDDASSVTCNGDCADKWPPLILAGTDESHEPTVGAGVQKELLGEAMSEAGEHVVTYGGWPLYRYESDSVGEASGHEVDENGGKWFAVTTGGERVE
jgi:predicted lipoprotein with Yx(FWY)xxD motif